MKKHLLVTVMTVSLLTASVKAEFGIWASAIYLNVNGTSQFYNTQLLGDPNSIGTVNFSGSLGSFLQNSNALTIRGAEIKTFRDNGGNVCGGTLYYTVYPVGARPSSPVFSPLTLNFYCDCASDGTFNACGGGTCTNGSDQKWQRIDQSVDLTQLSSGDYTVEIYYQISGAATSNTCGETRYDSNSGNNYTANFIISPPLPVNFSGLSGSVERSKIQLKWSIQSDPDIARYEVEKSSDGINFSTLAIIHSQGSLLPLSYSSADNSPASGNNFYRIKLYSIDNKITYSEVLRITFRPTVKNMLISSQSENELSVRLNSIVKGTYQLSIVNTAGQQITRQRLDCDGTDRIIYVNLNNKLAKGIYRLILKNSFQKYQESFIKQ